MNALGNAERNASRMLTAHCILAYARTYVRTHLRRFWLREQESFGLIARRGYEIFRSDVGRIDG